LLPDVYWGSSQALLVETALARFGHIGLERSGECRSPGEAMGVRRVRLSSERVRLYTPAHRIAREIRYAIVHANQFVEHQRIRPDQSVQVDAKFTFTITHEGIEVKAAYLCYRAIDVATWDQLAASGFSGLSTTIRRAYQRLIVQIRHIRLGSSLNV
jgi:hypothetical protein